MKRRPSLFHGHAIDHNGAKRRLTQAELREAWRLWCKHADIRSGRVRP